MSIIKIKNETMKQANKSSRRPASKTRGTTAKRRSTARSRSAARPTAKLSLHHHAKRIYHATPKFVHGMIAGAFLGIVVVASLGYVRAADALTINSPSDCDDYAVIRCGVNSTGDLQNKYHDAGVANIYSYFDIGAKDVNSMGDTAVSGVVHDNGNVTVKGKVVATDARTAARLFVKGSTKHTVGGTTFYVRHVTSEFARQQVPAYIVMKGDKFVYAILASCGNPVVATDVPTAVGEVVTTTPKPPKQTPPPATPVVETASKVTSLPNTGPGAVILVFVMALAGGYIFHMRHQHKQRHLAHATHHGSHRAHRSHKRS
jgi:hypothetical protein